MENGCGERERERGGGGETRNKDGRRRGAGEAKSGQVGGRRKESLAVAWRGRPHTVTFHSGAASLVSSF